MPLRHEKMLCRLRLPRLAVYSDGREYTKGSLDEEETVKAGKSEKSAYERLSKDFSGENCTRKLSKLAVPESLTT